MKINILYQINVEAVSRGPAPVRFRCSKTNMSTEQHRCDL